MWSRSPRTLALLPLSTRRRPTVQRSTFIVHRARQLQRFWNLKADLSTLAVSALPMSTTKGHETPVVNVRNADRVYKLSGTGLFSSYQCHACGHLALSSTCSTCGAHGRRSPRRKHSLRPMLEDFFEIRNTRKDGNKFHPQCAVLNTPMFSAERSRFPKTDIVPHGIYHSFAQLPPDAVHMQC